MLLYYIYPIL